MQVKVTFRVNTETGEVEFFQVDDMGQTRQITEHDALHEDIALAIAQVIDPRADVSEVLPVPREAAPAMPVPHPAATRRQAQGLGQSGSE
jgi:FtsH ternary system domain X3